MTHYKHWIIGLMLGTVMLGQGVCFADRDEINLYNGKVVEGKLMSSPGELFLMRTGFGTERYFKRLEMNGHDDMVTTHTNKKYYGMVEFIDAYKIYLRTDQGKIRLWRMNVRNIVLGHPNELRRFGGNDKNLEEKTTRKRFFF